MLTWRRKYIDDDKSAREPDLSSIKMSAISPAFKEILSNRAKELASYIATCLLDDLPAIESESPTDDESEPSDSFSKPKDQEPAGSDNDKVRAREDNELGETAGFDGA
jgi:hypothetical protein